MAQRIDALVNVNMTAEEVADEIGCLPSEVVQYGNGYAVIEVVEHGPLDEEDDEDE